MAELQTFSMPEAVTGTESDVRLGHRLIRAWQADGILQVTAGPAVDDATRTAVEASKRFFGLPLATKARHVSDLTYSGYIASGEEMTDGEADYSEIFTVCPDVPLDDLRVRQGWPCHGPAPWPDDAYARAMVSFMTELGAIGEKLLRLTALGLGLPGDAFARLTGDGWHHMRVLRFPAESRQTARGIGAHTDYGLLVIAYQDDVGGLYIRPPVDGEKRNRNWLPGESTAGMFENEEPWTFVRPVPGVLTVFPGDIMQFLTGGALLSTPHKVRLGVRDRYAMAYFHEPAFTACVRPLLEPAAGDHIFYGSHFTNMFMRCYPDRVTTKRIHAEDRLAVLSRLHHDAVTSS